MQRIRWVSEGFLLLLDVALRREKSFATRRQFEAGYFSSSSQRCEKLDPSFSDELNAWGGGSGKDVTSPKAVS